MFHFHDIIRGLVTLHSGTSGSFEGYESVWSPEHQNGSVDYRDHKLLLSIHELTGGVQTSIHPGRDVTLPVHDGDVGTVIDVDDVK